MPVEGSEQQRRVAVFVRAVHVHGGCGKLIGDRQEGGVVSAVSTSSLSLTFSLDIQLLRAEPFRICLKNNNT